VIKPLDLASGWQPQRWSRRMLIGRALWMGSVFGLIGAGATIMFVGMTEVFVPSDLAFIGYTRDELNAINPRLIPLIAHDRAGFGGGVFSTGLLLACILWKARPSRHVWQALTFAGAVGFLVAVGVHYPIGYLDTLHLLPAWLGLAAFGIGSLLCRPFYSHS